MLQVGGAESLSGNMVNMVLHLGSLHESSHVGLSLSTLHKQYG